MFNQFEPNVKATIAFLKSLNVNVNSSTVNETLQNHPDWPSMLCITDSLQKWNIPNAAGKIDKDKIDELPIPFIAHTFDSENPLAVITNITDNTVDVYQKNYSKLITESKEVFLKKWGGVYLLAEPNENSGEANYEKNKNENIVKFMLPVAAITLAVVFSLLFFTKNIKGISNLSLSVVGFYLQYSILLVGVIITTLLLWYEIDKNNPLLKKVCTGIVKGDCNAILTSRASKVFSWLSWSEVGFFYFAGSFITLISMPYTLTLAGWLNLLALPYTVFSVYYQWRIAKQWCVLCLMVQALLLLGAINLIVNGFSFIPPVYEISVFVKFAIIFILPVLIWYTVKPYILNLQTAKNTKREFLRIKFNTEIFETLLKKQKQITEPTIGIGINIGNPNATNEIVKVCNPYCGPCALAHPKIEELIEHNKNVKAKIVFTTPNDENDIAIKPVKHLLAIAAENNTKKTKQALDDWYLPKEKNYELFANKNKINGELREQGHKIESMDKWCKATDIKFTPTIFINGYQLPDAYSIADLEYFLKE